MDSPGRLAGRQQGETMLLEQMEGRERERKRNQREKCRGGGVAVLLNFNEYQGEFLLFFFFFLAPFTFFFFFSSGIHHLLHRSKSLSHKRALTRFDFGLFAVCHRMELSATHRRETQKS